MLTDAKIKAAKPRDSAYRLGDSEQLYLHVSPAGGRHWRMNYTYGRNPAGKPAQKTLAFGSYPAVTLVEARKLRDAAKAHLAAGRDPAIEKRVTAASRADANANTMRAVATAWYGKKRPTWAPKHADKVWQSLEENVLPAIGDLPITSIKAPRLLELLTAVEARGAIETAHRLRQRLSAVFVYGIAAGLCESDPAASLGKALNAKPRAKPQPSIIDGVRDQAERIEVVRTLLRKCEAERCRATTKLALRLIALTAVRPGELGGARWAEFEGIDWTARHGTAQSEALWRIPAARMKGDQDRKAETEGDHLVPLAPAALAILRALRPLTGDLALVFPSERHLHRPMSENTLRQLLIRAGYYQRHVPHGFRAAFSTIMNERLKEQGRGDDRAVVDLMLAHIPGNKVEGAYNRAAYMPRRREIAEEWAELLLEGFPAPEDHLGQPMRYAATGVGRSSGDS
jgi:integrase